MTRDPKKFIKITKSYKTLGCDRQPTVEDVIDALNKINNKKMPCNISWGTIPDRIEFDQTHAYINYVF